MKRIFCTFLCMAVLLSCVSIPTLAATKGGIIEALGDYLRVNETRANDGYIGIPVDISTYIKGQTTTQTPVILYVIGANTERIGTESDASIVQSMLDRGYIVVALDYRNHVKAVTPDLDWSVQGIRVNINSGAYLDGAAYASGINYVVPSGYNITLDEQYWSIDKHGADGSLQRIVDIWNSDFKSVKGDSTITYPDGQTKKVSEVTANTIYDCVKPDGTPIDLDLRMDLIYPTNPAKEVPVMTLMSSSETRVGSWTNATRPHLSGFLFSGYAGVIFDYAYTPMARNDHYGYFDGNTTAGHVTGDNYTYSMAVFNSSKSDTAAIRKIRWLADNEPETYKFDVNKIGVYGNSKGGMCTRLGNQAPELLPEMRYFDGHHGETRYENGDTQDDGRGIIDGGEAQPWLTYSDGSAIPSNVQFVYANCGGGEDTINYGHAPTYATGSMMDDSYFYFYPGVVNKTRIYDVPLLNYSCPERGHEFGYGLDKDYGVDTYKSLFTMADYWLKGEGANCEYIDVGGKTKDVDTNAKVTVKFTGAIPQEEIQKVTVTNDATGAAATGTWTASYGKTTWEFSCDTLQGGQAYTVNVPGMLLAENGKPLQGAKSLGFKTKYEQPVAPAKLASDEAMTLVKTEGTDNGVYYKFDAQDFANSTTTAIRFAVENDAANAVLVYALDSYDEVTPANSAVGALLGEVVLTGAGVYEIDVTDYVKALAPGASAAFMLKAKNNKETKVISDYDFENATTGADAATGVTFGSWTNRAVSTEQNNTADGVKSIKINYMTKNNNAYTPFLSSPTHVASFPSAIKPGSLTASDYGRKFNISIDVYDTTSRLLNLFLEKRAVNKKYDLIDWNSNEYTYQTEANTWNTYAFDYRVDNPAYWSNDMQKRTLTVNAESTTAQNPKPLYFDNVKVTEEITEVKLAPSGASLVLHPAIVQNLQPADVGYVENGDKAGTVLDSTDGMFISGSLRAGTNSTKTYIKLSLENYDGGQAAFSFSTKAGNRGTLRVYGISDTAAQDWNSETLSYINAPANDRYGVGVNTAMVFRGAPLREIKAAGAGEYSVDLTEYAQYMKSLGAESVTLVFVCTSTTKETLKTFQFDSTDAQTLMGYPGGGLSASGKTTDEDHTGNGGSSYYMTAAQYGYERLRLDLLGFAGLTAADLGRSFRVTYWAKATAVGSFYNSTMAQSSTQNTLNKKDQTVETANTWKQYTYEFTLDNTLLADVNNPATGVHALLNFELNSLGVSAGNPVTLYLDDIMVEEIGLGAVDIVPTEAKGKDKVVSAISFDEWPGLWSNNFLPEVNSDTGCFSTAGMSSIVGRCSLSDENHAGGEGKSFLFTPDGWADTVKFYNIFDHNLTEADLGRQFEVSFYAKANKAASNIYFHYGLMSSMPRMTTGSYVIGEGETPDTVNRSNNAYPENNKAYFIEADTWQQYKFSFTVDETMLPKTVITGGKAYEVAIATLGFIPASAINMSINIDDIVVKEIVQDKSYTYVQDCEDVTAANLGTTVGGNGFEMSGGTFVDKWSVSADENHTAGGAKSLQMYSTASWNRFKMYNIFDEPLTAKSIGDEYSVSFYLKSNKAGSFTLGLMGTSGAYNSAAAPGSTQTITVDAADIGAWKRYTYSTAVTEEMVTNAATCLTLMPSDLRQSAADPAILYIDDLYSTKLLDNAGTTLEIMDCAAVSGTGKKNTASLSAEGAEAANTRLSIRKSYLHFDGGQYENTQKATLEISVQSADGQTVQVYGVTDAQYPSELTYNNAPGNTDSEAMDSGKVYGSAPLAEFVATKPGTYTVDVTNYVKNHAPGDYVFALASNDAGGTAYINLDFDAFSFSKGADYTAFGGYNGSVSIQNGAAVIDGIANAGEGIRVLNVFGNDNAVCKEAETYTVSMDVTAAQDMGVTVGLTSKTGNTMLAGGGVQEQLTAGARKTVSFTVTASAQDVADSVCAVAVVGLGAGSITIDNVLVKSSRAVVADTEASLRIEKAQEGSEQPPIEDTVSIQSFDPATLTATIRADAPCKATVIFAGYSGDRLVSIKIVEDLQLVQGVNSVIAEGFNLEGITGGCIMVWKDLVSLAPLCKAYSF